MRLPKCLLILYFFSVILLSGCSATLSYKVDEPPMDQIQTHHRMDIIDAQDRVAVSQRILESQRIDLSTHEVFEDEFSLLLDTLEEQQDRLTDSEFIEATEKLEDAIDEWLDAREDMLDFYIDGLELRVLLDESYLELAEATAHFENNTSVGADVDMEDFTLQNDKLENKYKSWNVKRKKREEGFSLIKQRMMKARRNYEGFIMPAGLPSAFEGLNLSPEANPVFMGGNR